MMVCSKAFNLLELFWDHDIIVTIDMPSLGYYPAQDLYSAGQSNKGFDNTLKSTLEFLL